MKRKFLILIAFFALGLTAQSQKIQYGGMQQLGLIFGEKNVNLSFNLVNGIRFKRFFTGIGVDAQFVRRNNYYYSSYYSENTYRTSAVFVDGRYYINKNKNFFAVLNGGLNFISENLSSYGGYKSKGLPGYYGAVGIGFKARLSKEVFYSFDLSYAMRQMRLTNSYLNFLGVWQQDKYNLRQNCIVFKMGMEIF